MEEDGLIDGLSKVKTNELFSGVGLTVQSFIGHTTKSEQHLASEQNKGLVLYVPWQEHNYNF